MVQHRPRLSRWLRHLPVGGAGAAVLALCVLVTPASGAVSCAAAPETNAAPAFPLKVDPGKRYLEDSDGRPYLLNGDTAWSLIAQLNREDAELYLRDRKARGFNAVLVNLLEHRFASNAPANIYGDRPFRVDGDYGTPNEAYFRHVDWVLRRACELGLVVLLTPSYAGSRGGDEGWYGEMTANGPDKLRAFGRFLGARYRDLDNILWVQGGDYNPPAKDLVRAMAQGIRAADPRALQTAHTAPGWAALDYWKGEDWLAINNVYTYGSVREAAREQYDKSAVPFFLMESAYENEHDAGQRRVRRQAYEALLSGAFGHVYGNNPMWHFDGPGLYGAPEGWKAELDSPGARSMSVLRRLMSSVEWWRLVPDDALLLDDAGGDAFRATAARADDGSFALVYLPTGRQIRVDLRWLTGGPIAARWFDPASGRSLEAEGSPFSAAEATLSRTAPDDGGSGDWLLLLTSAAAASTGSTGQ